MKLSEIIRILNLNIEWKEREIINSIEPPLDTLLSQYNNWIEYDSRPVYDYRKDTKKIEEYENPNRIYLLIGIMNYINEMLSLSGRKIDKFATQLLFEISWEKIIDVRFRYFILNSKLVDFSTFRLYRKLNKSFILDFYNKLWLYNTIDVYFFKFEGAKYVVCDFNFDIENKILIKDIIN